MSFETWPIGAFASCDAGLGLPLDTVRKLGISTVHLHAPRSDARSEEIAERLRERALRDDITVTCMFAGFEGENYIDISATRRTVGLVPQEHRRERVDEFKRISDFAQLLGVPAVGMHMGFIPDDSQSPLYDDLVMMVGSLCEFCRGNSQSIHLETGQESVLTLQSFLRDVGCDNLFVNFDPANMILYGVAEPLPALRELGPHVRSVHCKDAKWSDHPGETWGEEVPLGQGNVDLRGFLQALRSIHYCGPLTIEREISDDLDRQRRDIQVAVAILESLREEMCERCHDR